MAISTDTIASGAKRGPTPGSITVSPMVRTKKNVPINSATYLFIKRSL